MKKLKWGVIAVLILATCASLIVISKSTVETPEALAERFIANINAKDKDGLWELIHPRCVNELSTIQRDFIDATFANGFNESIPEECNIRILPYDVEQFLPFESIAAWPVMPTHRVEVEFSTEYRTIGIARYIAKKDEEWFIVVPLIHEDRLRQRAGMKANMDFIGATWYEYPEGAWPVEGISFGSYSNVCQSIFRQLPVGATVLKLNVYPTDKEIVASTTEPAQNQTNNVHHLFTNEGKNWELTKSSEKRRAGYLGLTGEDIQTLIDLLQPYVVGDGRILKLEGRSETEACFVTGGYGNHGGYGDSYVFQHEDNKWVFEGIHGYIMN